jgi:hypothetical protein
MNYPDLTPFLTDDLRRAPWKGLANPIAGQCYISAEALFHLWGKHQNPPFTPHFVRWEDAPHWFLMNSQGEVLDATAGQFNTIPEYSQGKGKGFLTKEPSRRAQTVINNFKLTVT